jgi:anti-sigma factor RsiW
MTMNHVLDLLPFWVGGDLTREEMEAVDRHLAGCAACRDAATRIRTSQAWLKDALASPFEASDRERLRRGVLDRIRTEPTGRPTRRLALPSSLFATAAVLLVAFLTWHPYRGTVPVPVQGTPPPPKVAEKASPPVPQPRTAPPEIARATHLHARSLPKQESESPPQGEPARIEFQTSDPNIRIIWLAQAKPLPETIPPLQEAP